jgi:hypothetical protein
MVKEQRSRGGCGRGRDRRRKGDRERRGNRIIGNIFSYSSHNPGVLII